MPEEDAIEMDGLTGSRVYPPVTRVRQCDACYGERFSPFTGDECQKCCGQGVLRTYRTDWPDGD
jgi:DnaJ-class molecular chaperone